MTLVPLLLAPTVMGAAAVIERRLGPSAAGWMAAPPIDFAVAVLAVTVDAGAGAAAAMALSAPTHVFAQVIFALAFAVVLLCRGLILAAMAGVGAYVACSILAVNFPPVIAVGLSIAMLAAELRLMPQVGLRPASPRAPRGAPP